MTHSPLIGQDGAIAEQGIRISVQSRAGLKKDIITVNIIPTETETDTIKAMCSHGSPDKLNTIDKSPMMINGRLEKFTDISSMIIKWGEEEGALIEKEKGGKGARRRSQKMSELCSKFESNMEGQDINPDIDVGGRGEGSDTIPLKSKLERGPKIENISCMFEKSEQLVAITYDKANQSSPKTSY